MPLTASIIESFADQTISQGVRLVSLQRSTNQGLEICRKYGANGNQYSAGSQLPKTGTNCKTTGFRFARLANSIGQQYPPVKDSFDL